MSAKKKNEKNELFNIITIVLTAVIAVTLICSVIIAYNFKKQDNSPAAVTPQNGSDAPVSPADMIKTYDASQTGTVSEADSKTLAYFKSNYQDDYYRVNEIAYSILVDGSYSEYYETETVAYSTQGYLYNKRTQSSYEEQDLSSPVVTLYTPEKSYVIYPDMQSYFEGEQSTANYNNTIDFPGDTFKTGTININGRDYYYEETTDDSSVTYRYCFDEDGNLSYNVASSPTGTITTRYVEYSKDVDYSLFEIPQDYTLVQ